jgi:hypothetical protein
MNSPAVSFLVQAEAPKGEKAFYFSEIETMLTFFVKARLGAFWYSINCLVFFTICAIRTQPAAPRTRKSQLNANMGCSAQIECER